MHAFSAQESRHFECHRRLNEILKSNGYPELADVEKRMARSYERLRERSLRTQLAYNAGFECMTNGFTNWMINKRRQLFAGGSPHVVSFFLMHAVEETEHKTVAYDLYMAYSGKFWPRAWGVLHGSFHVLGFSLLGDGLPLDAPCDPFAQDCQQGLKCAAYDMNGNGAWDSTKCVDVMGNGTHGDPCTAEGGATGVDDCDVGVMCWNADENSEGTCVAMCTGSSEQPVCAQAAGEHVAPRWRRSTSCLSKNELSCR